MPLPATSRPLATVLAAALAGGLLVGCGHPASATECDELFAKSAELELRAQRITDPKTIEKEAREQLHYARPGEVVYVSPPPPAPPKPAISSARK